MSVRLYSRKSKAVSDLSSSEDPVECRGATPWSRASDVAHSELYLLTLLIAVLFFFVVAVILHPPIVASINSIEQILWCRPFICAARCEPAREHLDSLLDPDRFLPCELFPASDDDISIVWV